jgi:1-acyl-sn-glycerol-3-phosphate acyltransferase
MKKVTERLVSFIVWTTGICAFVPIGLSILAATLFIDPKHIDGFIKAGCRCLLRFLFIHVEVEGLRNVQPNRTFLFVSNHVNLFDVFVLKGYIPGFVRGLELDIHFQWFFYGTIIRRLGTIPVSHTNARTALESLNRAKDELADGTSVVVLPEGHRTLDGKFGPFKRGAFLLARDAGVDIIPLVMVGAYRIKRKGSSLIRPGKMILRIGEPILYQDIKDLKINDIRIHVHDTMMELFNR